MNNYDFSYQQVRWGEARADKHRKGRKHYSALGHRSLLVCPAARHVTILRWVSFQLLSN